MESQSDQQTPHSIIYFVLRNPRYCSQDKQLKTGHGECESRLPKLLHTESEREKNVLSFKATTEVVQRGIPIHL